MDSKNGEIITHKWMVFSPGLPLLTQPTNSYPRHLHRQSMEHQDTRLTSMLYWSHSVIASAT